MQTHTYANGREICSKAADGRSAAAMPDVCWSPPPPPAGPVPIPYPNTAFARDLTHGTRTIVICGTEVAQKDKSFFSTSTGNEPATSSFAKGLNTGVITGKAYFTSWSMDVLVEGLNVARHQDTMTHNHASPGGNTPSHPFIDDATARGDCAQDLDKARRECASDGDEEGDDKAENLRRKSSKSFLKKIGSRINSLGDGLKKKHGFSSSKNTAWMEHCDGLWIKPYTGYRQQIDGFVKQLENVKMDITTVTESLVKPVVEKVKQELIEKLGREAAEKALKAGGRSAARWGVGAAGLAAGGVGAIATEFIATAWNIVDLGVTAYEGVQLTREVVSSIGSLREVLGDFSMATKSLDKLIAHARGHPQETMAEVMSLFSRFNRCTRARRCILVPYAKTSTALSMLGEGCCPGQTGHHILPDEMTKGGNCPGYNKLQAPTICVEGTNNSHGSHGRIHDRLVKLIKNHKSGGLFGWGASDTMTYEQARQVGVQSIVSTFRDSACDEKCLAAQLDHYYKSKCNDSLPALAGKRIEEDEIDAGDMSTR